MVPLRDVPGGVAQELVESERPTSDRSANSIPVHNTLVPKIQLSWVQRFCVRSKQALVGV